MVLLKEDLDTTTWPCSFAILPIQHLRLRWLLQRQLAVVLQDEEFDQLNVMRLLLRGV